MISAYQLVHLFPSRTENLQKAILTMKTPGKTLQGHLSATESCHTECLQNTSISSYHNLGECWLLKYSMVGVKGLTWKSSYCGGTEKIKIYAITLSTQLQHYGLKNQKILEEYCPQPYKFYNTQKPKATDASSKNVSALNEVQQQRSIYSNVLPQD